MLKNLSILFTFKANFQPMRKETISIRKYDISLSEIV